MDPEVWRMKLMVPSPPQKWFKGSIGSILLPVLYGAVPVYTLGLALPLLLIFLHSASQEQCIMDVGIVPMVACTASESLQSSFSLVPNLPYSLVLALLLVLLLGGDIETNPGPETEQAMAKFPEIRDCANTGNVICTLWAVGEYYKRAAEHSEAVPQKVHHQAVRVLHPLASFLQRKATDEQKRELADSIAGRPDIFEPLCEHVLYPFLREISTHGPKQITGSSAGLLSLIKLLQVFLMEWSDSDSNQAKERLVKSGCIFMLFKELTTLTRVMQLTENEFAQHLIQTATLTISNCVDPYGDLHMKLYPETDVEGALTPYFNSPNAIIRHVCKMTYYQFSSYLPSASKFMDCPGDVMLYTELLYDASISTDFVASVDRKLLLDATGLLHVLMRLFQHESNRKAVLGKLHFYDALTNFLKRGREKETQYTLEFLWQLLTIDAHKSASIGHKLQGNAGKGKGKGKPRGATTISENHTKQQLLSTMSEITHLIETTATRVPRELSSALLWCIQKSPIPQDVVNDLSSCLSYVNCCYQHKMYQECCLWCDCVRELSKRNERVKDALDNFLLVKGKAKFHIYHSRQLLLWRSEKFQEVWELREERKLMYPQVTKEVISLLGSLRLKGIRDEESEQFLDLALMDYIRELNEGSGNKQKQRGKTMTNVFYCMLCLEFNPICQSHIVPASVLKHIFGENTSISVKGASGMSLEIQPKRIEKATFYMLCGDCDNVLLSKDEQLFSENILRVVYNNVGPAPHMHMQRMELQYGEWLYRFCVGVIFRAMALNRAIIKASNEDEVYQLFRLCRSILLNQNPTSMPQIALFFTPGIPIEDDQETEENACNLWKTLNRHTSFTFSNIPLSSTVPVIVKMKYFFLVHFGIFSIVAPIVPSELPLEYIRFLVNPAGGQLNIPDNDERMGLNPPALKVLYEEKSQTSSRDYQERFADYSGYKPNIIKTHLSEEATAKQLQELKERGMDERTMPHMLNFLPPKFDIDRQTNTVTLPPGHQILIHDTLSESSSHTGHTILLAIEDEAPDKPYVIIHSYVETPNLIQNLAFYVSTDNFEFVEFLKDHKSDVKGLRELKLDLFRAPSRILPSALRQSGLVNYQTLLYHLTRISTFDSKCLPGNTCWYCTDKCEMCMKFATPGFSFTVACSIAVESRDNATPETDHTKQSNPDVGDQPSPTDSSPQIKNQADKVCPEICTDSSLKTQNTIAVESRDSSTPETDHAKQPSSDMGDQLNTDEHTDKVSPQIRDQADKVTDKTSLKTRNLTDKTSPDSNQTSVNTQYQTDISSPESGICPDQVSLTMQNQTDKTSFELGSSANQISLNNGDQADKPGPESCTDETSLKTQNLTDTTIAVESRPSSTPETDCSPDMGDQLSTGEHTDKVSSQIRDQTDKASFDLGSSTNQVSLKNGNQTDKPGPESEAHTDKSTNITDSPASRDHNDQAGSETGDHTNTHIHLRFCGENCKSFVDSGLKFEEIFTAERQHTEVTFKVLQLGQMILLKATHLLNISCRRVHQEISIDLYQASEGVYLPSRCLFTLFHAKSYSEQTFGEFFVTKELQVNEPLPHVVNVSYSTETLALISYLLNDGVASSGIDILSLTKCEEPHASTLETLEHPKLDVQSSISIATQEPSEQVDPSKQVADTAIAAAEDVEDTEEGHHGLFD